MSFTHPFQRSPNPAAARSLPLPESSERTALPDEASAATPEPAASSTPATEPEDKAMLRRRIEELGEWFHNINLGGVETAPQHFLGNYPQLKWERIEASLPARLDGMTVLDVGCNAGFYALECKRRGARRVVGVDADARYLAQARLAAETLGLEIEWRQESVYALAGWQEQFDLVLFMGVFYHLRYPLYALDLMVKRMRGRLVFQTMLRGQANGVQPAADYEFWDQSPFEQPGFPCMYFIEQRYANDPTNWWIPNAAAVEAMLRSAGLRLLAHPEDETWICELATVPAGEDEYVWNRELAATL